MRATIGILMIIGAFYVVFFQPFAKESLLPAKKSNDNIYQYKKDYITKSEFEINYYDIQSAIERWCDVYHGEIECDYYKITYDLNSEISDMVDLYERFLSKQSDSLRVPFYN